jgi:hypothetical protein
MLNTILSSKLTKIALPFMLAFAFVVMMGATVTMAAPAPDSSHVQQIIQAAPVNPNSASGLMAWLAVPTTTLTINTDAYLDFVFQYANLIIGAMLMLAGIKAGFAFGFRILNQIGTIFGG